MILHLRVENLILIQEAVLSFGGGLNILTGETGAGKSAILSAIRLLSGDKADPALIRQGENRAVIEAEISPSPRFAALAHEEGIELPADKCLIRRELSRTGKSRIFLEDEQISLAQLRKWMQGEMELVDQSSAPELCSREAQREALDLLADIDIKTFSSGYERERELRGHLGQLESEKESRSKACERSQGELSEIEEAGWRKGEEEELSLEHQKLSSAETVSEKLALVLAELESSSHLRRLSASLEPLLKEPAELLKSAAIEIGEAERLVQMALNQAEPNPQRLHEVEKRIAVLEKLKRRFGPDIESVRQHLTGEIAEGETCGESIEAHRRQLADQVINNQQYAAKLSERRKKAALLAQKKIVETLHSLNLPEARFSIEIEPKELGPDGQDQIRFLFAANPGQPLLPLEECASGGELSRLLLALKSTIAEKEAAACLIFDEIDSNVGGHTAAILGQKLKALAEHRQVICVTHFVQVAKCADCHFLVAKKTEENAAITRVQQLLGAARETEYARMVGTSLKP